MTRRGGDAAGRGLRPWVERAWSGEGPPGAAWWLRPASLLYGALSAAARTRARRARRGVAGIRVVAIGGLTVGGAGKTSLARWAAQEAHARGRRPALLLRGHGGSAAHLAPQALPPARHGDAAAIRWFGDEAIAHRAALSTEIPVIAGRDRLTAARLAASLGADTAILDDGWEQPMLVWDSLWVVADPRRPTGNGWVLPAGPLRRPPSSLLEANVITGIAEASDELEMTELAQLAARHAPGRPLVRFRRRAAPVGALEGRREAAEVRDLGGVVLVSSLGSPDRLERFLVGQGATVRDHLAFPDHAPWNPTLVHRAAAAAVREGAGALLVTDKDAARARLLPAMPLPIFVLTTRLEPVDDPAPLLDSLIGGSGPVAAVPTIG